MFVSGFWILIPTHFYQTLGLQDNRPIPLTTTLKTMLDEMEIASNEGIPALPTLLRIAPVAHVPGAGDGQNWPSASEGSAVAVAITLNPPQCILMQGGSDVSSITYAVMTSSVD